MRESKTIGENCERTWSLGSWSEGDTHISLCQIYSCPATWSATIIRQRRQKHACSPCVQTEYCLRVGGDHRSMSSRDTHVTYHGSRQSERTRLPITTTGSSPEAAAYPNVQSGPVRCLHLHPISKQHSPPVSCRLRCR